MHRSLRSTCLWLLVFSASAVAQVRVVPTPTGANLEWPSTGVFHTTPAQVSDVRESAIPHSSGRVAAWSEQRGGVAQPYYAISLDGSHVDAVKPTSYELGFRRAQFDPLLAVPSFADSALPSGGNVYIVQYITQPLLGYSEAIGELGGEVFDYIAQHAHLVRMSPSERDAVARLPFVRWIGEYHAELRVDPELLDALRSGDLTDATRYNVQVFERGAEEQQFVAEVIASLGGQVHLIQPEGFRMEATLSTSALIAVAGLDQVRFIDAWGPPEVDLDIVRQVSGANYLESNTGFSGQGVRVEVLDVGTDLAHPDLAGAIQHGVVPNGDHGTCTSGIVCGTGLGSAQARGLLPQGQLISGYYAGLVGGTRYSHTAQLVNPSLVYQCVLQTNSWGSSLTANYTSVSAEMDDIIAIDDILILQSQSNAGSTQSRPEAWAKNILSVGGVSHHNTASFADDTWGGASIGPATDGRLKPDLCHWYDAIYCTDQLGGAGYSSGNYEANFGGTSAATPITAGHCGLFFQLWTAGSFGNTPGAGTVFQARPHFTLAKAAMVNTATQYVFSGASANLTRVHQGWGLANVQSLYDRRAKTFFVDQTDVINNLGSKSYPLTVAGGEPDLRVTMVYRDAMGTVSSSQHRKNDLTLVVTSPSGTTYYGNVGLNAGNWSTPGGSANTKDTVENVFVQNPSAGTWTVTVRGDDINTNPVTNTPASTADFALWATGVTFGGCIATPPIVYCTSKVTSNFTSPTIGWSGQACITGPGLQVTLSNALPNKSALIFYGSAPYVGPFQGGTLCALQPLVRSPLTATDGASTALYNVALDASMAGTTRYYQWWFRDPLDTWTVGLSNALQVAFSN